MCTVTYLPLSSKGYIISSNRDENRQRSASEPASLETHDSTLIFPKDPKSGGSWICSDSSGRSVCLLNGAFKKHKHQPPYRKSRGLVVLEVFNYESFTEFLDTYNLEDIEPFTLILRDEDQLRELRWDGEKKHITSLAIDKAHLWASSTLYNDELIQKRREWFNLWLRNTKNYNVEDIMAWHRHTGDGDSENDLVMNRNGMVETISISSILNSMDMKSMTHLDLLNETKTEHRY